jgi:WD40 repeat protein
MTGWYVDISSEGAWTVTGSKHGTVQLWETRAGLPGAVLMGHKGDINEFAFSPFGERVVLQVKMMLYD